VEHVSLDPAAYLLTLLVVIFSSAVFLGVGQALVGLLKSPDTVNAVGRLSFLPLFALGLFGHSQFFGTTFATIALWSPGGAVVTLLSGAMHPAAVGRGNVVGSGGQRGICERVQRDWHPLVSVEHTLIGGSPLLGNYRSFPRQALW
jgi:hypothetical protein